jgi:hypothetical protein
MSPFKVVSAGVSSFLLFGPSVGWGGYLCIGPSAGTHQNVTVECGTLEIHDNRNDEGFSEDGQPWCADEPSPLVRLPTGHGLTRWTISASATDPFENSGALPADGWLYLWLASSGSWFNGMASAEFGLEGTLIPVSIEGLNGAFVLQDSLPTVLMAAPGCPTGPDLLARVRVEHNTSLERSSWGRSKAPYR